jgi:hypothetical protein
MLKQSCQLHRKRSSTINGGLVRLITLTAGFLAAVLTGCSVYQSDGRKFLESQAIQFSEARANLTSCGSNPVNAEKWNSLEKEDRAEILVATGDSFELRIVPVPRATAHDEVSAPANSPEQPFSCEFRYNSAQEMYEKMSPAIEFCLHLSPGDCTGEFAFR